MSSADRYQGHRESWHSPDSQRKSPVLGGPGRVQAGRGDPAGSGSLHTRQSRRTPKRFAATQTTSIRSGHLASDVLDRFDAIAGDFAQHRRRVAAKRHVDGDVQVAAR